MEEQIIKESKSIDNIQEANNQISLRFHDKEEEQIVQQNEENIDIDLLLNQLDFKDEYDINQNELEKNDQITKNNKIIKSLCLDEESLKLLKKIKEKKEKNIGITIKEKITICEIHNYKVFG